MRKRVCLAMDGTTEISTLVPESPEEYELILRCMEVGLIDDGSCRRGGEDRTRANDEYVRLEHALKRVLATATVIPEEPVKSGPRPVRRGPSRWRKLAEQIRARGRARREQP